MAASRRRPEHVHYDAVESYLRRSIQEGRDFLFDDKAFAAELLRLWDEYDIPHQVRMCVCVCFQVSQPCQACVRSNEDIAKQNVVSVECCCCADTSAALPYTIISTHNNKQSLQSFIRNLHVAHVKKTAPQVKNALASIVDEYVQGRTSIIALARKCNYPPYLLSRFLVEAITKDNLGPGGKKVLTDAMRRPLQRLASLDVIAPQYRASEQRQATASTTTAKSSATTTTRLAREVQDAMIADPMYGPRHDKERHIVGVEFEVVLEYKLKALSE